MTRVDRVESAERGRPGPVNPGYDYEASARGAGPWPA